MARSYRAAALACLWIWLAIPASARALAIYSFAPGDVTLGTRLVIEGDFGELVTRGARPKVEGTRIDTPRTVTFEVLSVSAHKIVARVKKVPSSKKDPAAGKTWSLEVSSPEGAAGTAEADETFTTAAPELAALLDGEGRPGDTLALFAFDPGNDRKHLTVLVGKKKAKILGVSPLGPSEDADPWSVRFLAPTLRNGFYPVRIENPLGRSPTLAELLIYGSRKGGLTPRASASMEERPRFESSLCRASAEDGVLHVSACDGEACARALELEFQPNPDGGFAPAAVSVTELGPGAGAPAVWVAALAGARLVPSPAAELVSGSFVAELEPEGRAQGPRLRIRGYFQAPSPDGFSVR